MTMKTIILALGVLSMAGWATSTTNAAAFNLLPLCCHHHGKPVCRQYNAFSPICCGNACDGCCPLPYCNGCWQPPIQQSLPMMYGNNCCDNSCMASDSAYTASGQPVMMPPPQVPAPPATSPGFSPPPPTASPVYNQTSMRWNPQGAYSVQPAGYNSGYPTYPMSYNPATYNPVNNYPAVPAMPAPYYWYNGR